jgi:hypothetical protein
MASTIKVNTLDTQSGTDVTITAGKAITGANTQFKITGGSNTNVLTTDGSGGLTWGTAGSTVKVAYLVDEKTAGTAGGTFTSGAWQQRDLQTEYYDTIGVTFSTNSFVLPVGTFYVDWSAPAFGVQGHQSRLYNTTTAAIVKAGTNSYSKLQTDGRAQTRSSGSALVVVSSGTETLKIEHRCYGTIATEGFGVICAGVMGSTVAEVYTTVSIMQIS